jgi:hypothetical protein
LSDISKINIDKKEYFFKDAAGRARAEEAATEAENAAKEYTDAQVKALKGAVSADFNTLEKIEDKIEELDSSVDEIDEQIGSTNAKVLQVEATANNALALAQNKNLNKVFNTTSEMYTWLANAENKGQLQVGSALYIKEADVPDWWVTEVLNAPNADGRYYNIAPLEAEGAGGAAGSTVSVQQTLTSGTKIGSITIDGSPTNLYAPEIQNAFGNVVVGSTTIAADSKTDSLTLVAGENVTITPDAINDKIIIAATDTTYDEQIKDINTYLQRGCRNFLQVTVTTYNSQLGTTITFNSNNQLIVEGTHTGTGIDPVIGKANLKANTEYILSGCPAGGGKDKWGLRINNTGNWSSDAWDIGEGVKFTVPTDGEYKIAIRLNVDITYNHIFYPMIRLASDLNDTYEVYYEDAMTTIGKTLTHGDVVDNLNTAATDLPLSANQGDRLRQAIGNIKKFCSWETYIQSTANPIYIKFTHSTSAFFNGWVCFAASGPGYTAAALVFKTYSYASGYSPGGVIQLINNSSACKIERVKINNGNYLKITPAYTGVISVMLDDVFSYYIGASPTDTGAVWTNVY